MQFFVSVEKCLENHFANTRWCLLSGILQKDERRDIWGYLRIFIFGTSSSSATRQRVLLNAYQAFSNLDSTWRRRWWNLQVPLLSLVDQNIRKRMKKACRRQFCQIHSSALILEKYSVRWHAEDAAYQSPPIAIILQLKFSPKWTLWTERERKSIVFFF